MEAAAGGVQAAAEEEEEAEEAQTSSSSASAAASAVGVGSHSSEPSASTSASMKNHLDRIFNCSGVFFGIQLKKRKPAKKPKPRIDQYYYQAEMKVKLGASHRARSSSASASAAPPWMPPRNISFGCYNRSVRAAMRAYNFGARVIDGSTCAKLHVFPGGDNRDPLLALFLSPQAGDGGRRAAQGASADDDEMAAAREYEAEVRAGVLAGDADACERLKSHCKAYALLMREPDDSDDHVDRVFSYWERYQHKISGGGGDVSAPPSDHNGRLRLRRRPTVGSVPRPLISANHSNSSRRQRMENADPTLRNPSVVGWINHVNPPTINSSVGRIIIDNARPLTNPDSAGRLQNNLLPPTRSDMTVGPNSNPRHSVVIADFSSNDQHLIANNNPARVLKTNPEVVNGPTRRPVLSIQPPMSINADPRNHEGISSSSSSSMNRNHHIGPPMNVYSHLINAISLPPYLTHTNNVNNHGNDTLNHQALSTSYNDLMNVNYPQLIDPINPTTFSPYRRSLSDDDHIYYTYNYRPMNLMNPPTNLVSSSTLRRATNANATNNNNSNNNYDAINPVAQNISIDPGEYIYANRLYDQIYPVSPHGNVASPGYGMNATRSGSGGHSFGLAGHGGGTTSLPLVSQPSHGHHPISSDTADTSTRSRAEIQTEDLLSNHPLDVWSPNNNTNNVWSPNNNNVWSPGLSNPATWCAINGSGTSATCLPASPPDRANVAPPAQLSPDYYPFPSDLLRVDRDVWSRPGSGIPGPPNPAHSVGTFTTDPYLPHDFELDMAAVDFHGGRTPHIHLHNATSTPHAEWLDHANHALDGNVRHEVIPWHDGVDDTFDMFDILGDSEQRSLIFNNNRLGSNPSNYDSRQYHT